MARVKFNNAGAIRIVRQASSEAALEVMREVFEESQRQVPVFSGALRDSGRLNVFASSITITYSVPYAAIQHENLTFRHPVGKAKYLEDAYNAIVPGARAKIQKRVNEVLR